MAAVSTFSSQAPAILLIEGIFRAPEDRRDEIGEHLESCSRCQAEIETVDDNDDSLVTALRRQPVEETFETEPQCKEALARIIDIGRDASFSTQMAAAVAPAEHEIELGILGHYQLLEKLGQGGMGTVYKALHLKLQKVVALKVLPAGRMQNSAAVARFEREMIAVGKLSHPNIVAAHDAGEIDGTHYLVMELVNGVDLSTLVRRCGPLPVADACELMRQAAVGLQHAHGHGMVHRDIKPSNLMLTTSGQVKILDMGLALLDSNAQLGVELTTTGQMMGTLDYMAPEQGNDTHGVDIRADIYALGATMYKLLTGEAPFAGERYDTPMKKLTALATKEPAPVQDRRPDVPDEVAEIVHRCLAKEPEDRFATPAQVAEALALWSVAWVEHSRILR